MESFVHSSLAWIIATALGVISVLIAIFEKKKKELKYEIRSYELIHKGENQVEGLSHSFRGELVNNLTVSEILLWNSGNVSLRSNDIVPKRPLKICTCDGSIILEKSIIYQPEGSNSFAICKSTESQFLLDFDCVGKQEGIVLKVYHTGDSATLALDCKVIDGRVVNNKSTRDYSVFYEWLWLFFKMSFILILNAFIIAGLSMLQTFLGWEIPNYIVIGVPGVIMMISIAYTFFGPSNTDCIERMMHRKSKFLIAFDQSKDLKKK